MERLRSCIRTENTGGDARNVSPKRSTYEQIPKNWFTSEHWPCALHGRKRRCSKKRRRMNLVGAERGLYLARISLATAGKGSKSLEVHTAAASNWPNCSLYVTFTLDSKLRVRTIIKTPLRRRIYKTAVPF